jgi:hypothetical protein
MQGQSVTDFTTVDQTGDPEFSLPRLLKQHGMVDVSIVYHTVTVDHAFLQLLIGGPRGACRVKRNDYGNGG